MGEAADRGFVKANLLWDAACFWPDGLLVGLEVFEETH